MSFGLFKPNIGQVSGCFYDSQNLLTKISRLYIKESDLTVGKWHQ